MSASGNQGGSGHVIEDEGTPLTERKKLNFVGAGVVVTDDAGDDASDVTITGGAGGEANTTSNVGTGEGLAKAKVVVDLPFKSVLGTAGEILITGNVNDLTLSFNGLIAYAKLNLTGAILNADLAGSIAYSKLSLTGAILNADLAGSIAYAKLILTGAVLNADLAGSIAYAKLILTNSIVNGDISASALILLSKLEAGTKGDLGISNGTNFIKVAVGTNNQVLTADSAEASGIKWATGGGGGGINILVAVKTADETINSDATLTDDTDLQVELLASKTYAIFGFIYWESPTAPDFKYALSAPAGATGLKSSGNWTASGNATQSDHTTSQFLTGVAGSTRCTPFMVTIRNSTTAGTLAFQWAQNTINVADTILRINSWMVAIQID